MVKIIVLRHAVFITEHGKGVLHPVPLRPRTKEQVQLKLFSPASHIMQRSFQLVMSPIVMTAAILVACVPASASVLILDDNNTHDLNYLVAEDDVSVENSTTVNLLDGGEITGYLDAYSNSTVIVSGGSIEEDLQTYDSSKVTVSGGSIAGYLYAVGNSEVTVSGGSIGAELWVENSAVVTIYGTDFNFDDFDYDDGSELDGEMLTGVLADGTSINWLVLIQDDAMVFLDDPANMAAVPEPSSLAMFGIGALGLFGYSRRRRHTSGNAS